MASSGTRTSPALQRAFEVVIAATTLAFSQHTWAQTERTSATAAERDDSTTRQARDLFSEGTERARRGDWSQALTAFERSAALRPHAVTTYNIGYCERALGRYTRARKRLGDALAQNAAHGGAELPAELAAAAKGYLAEIERQIARLVVSLTPEGATVLVDGRPLERAVSDGPRPVLWASTRDLGPAEVAAATTFELHVDPGTHVFVVSKPGYQDNVTTRSFDPGSEASVVLTLAPAAPPAAPPPPPTPPPAKVEVVDSRLKAPPARLPLYIALGVGGAGLGTGIVAGAIALSIKNEGVSHYPQAYTPADVSTAGFIVGGLGIAAGAIYWWWSSSRAAAPSAPAAASASAAAKNLPLVLPWLSPGGAGVQGSF